jgi:hypothetical protein
LAIEQAMLIFGYISFIFISMVPFIVKMDIKIFKNKNTKYLITDSKEDIPIRPLYKEMLKQNYWEIGIFLFGMFIGIIIATIVH